ncbi:MAG: cysteine desulfurase [Firmicutes bacterium HGW-Firmicutes-2]|jgi:cysteine desulfurase/selenocysteine lyase|nr:MAG: cysteine desulfurase [Firmicutes bacterium HGW-Firmicutes-2]
MNATKAWVEAQFPLIRHHGSLVYLDSAATTQKPEQVINRISKYNRQEHANIHRGVYDLSQKATMAYDQVRQQVKYLLSAQRDEEIIFTKGTTESLNLIAYSYGMPMLSEGDEVVLSIAEHHSNIIPWQQLVKNKKAVLKYLPVDIEGRIIESAIGTVITEKTKIVSVTMVSNAFGTLQPIASVIKRAHEVGAVVVLDGAQSVPHKKVDVKALDADFLVFSSHKMFGPTGVGALYGKYALLEKMIPYQTGGDMIEYVEEQTSTFAPIPQCFEAGTPNIEGIIGFGEAIRFIEQVGYDFIHKEEMGLTKYAYDQLSHLNHIQIYGPLDIKDRGPVISFNVEGVHPHDVTTILDQDHIAIRAGHHCAQLLMKRIGLPSTCRVSFAVYNTTEDIDRLIESLKKVRKWLGYES